MGIKGALEDAGQAVDAYQRFAARLTALGSIGVGVVAWIGPGKLGEEVPQHRIIGAGFAAFGALFLVALAARGGLARRAKNLLLAFVCALVALGAGYVAAKEGRIVYDLERSGVECTLPVSSAGRKLQSNPPAWSLVFRDGRRRFELESDHAVPVGTPVTFLVHPGDSTVTALATAEATWMEIADARGKRWAIVIGAGVALLAALAALAFLWGFVTGAPAPDEAP